ncbi:MAG: excinuclease ABC subunit UvrC, partial [Bdellovibrionales bacterium]|nr:excinuclease ABC subunit UvrC [Bdellovibrionales bacterium]
DHPLADTVANLPKRSGVYLMKDAKGTVIYVGKAKHLRNRVRSYFSGNDERHSVPYILKRVTNIEVIVTETEHAAFVLERDLITKYKPRYNIRLKDDKSYLHVRIDRQAAWPRLELVRRPMQDGADYYGPFTFSYELRTVLDLIRRVVPLRTCRDAVFHNRTRPCLEYQIKRCAGPCCLEVEREQYDKWLDQAVSILNGKTSGIQEELQSHMERASDELRFEDAGVYRDRLNILENFSTRQAFVSPGIENRDVFAFYREETLMVISVLRMRFGRIQESENFCLEDVEVPTEEVIESAVLQFYRTGREVPEDILLPLEIDGVDVLRDELKRLRDGGAVELHVPRRGAKFRLLGLAGVNAKEHFIAQFDREARYQKIAEAIARTCQLEQMPRRIECLDISNLQGSDIVGAVVSFYDGEPDKSRYRKYKISFQDKPDDFAAVEEVVRRKLKGSSGENLPDLLIIDGGKGQLDRALSAAHEVDSPIDIVALAKIRDSSGKKKGSGSRASASDLKVERIFLPGDSDPRTLDLNAESTRFLQRVRDEAHRYVIEFHRQSRSRRAHRSKLDDIPGIGPERRGRLLRKFGSIAALLKAPPEEVAKVGRMPKSLAEKVLSVLKK